MSAAPLLLEIGCEEIPARMIRGATADLERLLLRTLDLAGLSHGDATSWGGARRLAVRVERVQARQADCEELVIGPPARIAFDDRGRPAGAAKGFAKKQGIEVGKLEIVETEKGRYAGFKRWVEGAALESILARDLPPAVEGMAFPKAMRWGDGTLRWVRPVHWVVALHGDHRLEMELFRVRAGSSSVGHRFRSGGAVDVGHPDDYEAALEGAGVIADPGRRREMLVRLLREAAEERGGRLVEDAELLDEVVNLVEWPGVVEGSFGAAYLELPRELLVTTLRHHQKCFSIQSGEGELLPHFLAVTNTDQDPAGHIRRGNEWVVGGRLDDARFFWHEDRKRPLDARSPALEGVVFHASVGNYADKATRMARIASGIAAHLSLDKATAAHCAEAARLSKNDLITGTVGEFPELQGKAGGLLLAEEGAPEAVARGVYEHYQPLGRDDDVPSTVVGRVVSVADKLDSVACLIAAGESPTGTRDPLGLRRASTGIFRVVIEAGWPLSLRSLFGLASGGEDGLAFLLERLKNFLREESFTVNEIQAVLRPRVDPRGALAWPLPDVVARLAAIRTVRARSDFALLADLIKRVDNILLKGREMFDQARARVAGGEGFREDKPAAVELREMMGRCSAAIDGHAEAGEYTALIDLLAGFVDPVERFFNDVLVLDPDHPEATLHRRELLTQLSAVLTRCFDIRELAGQAERRSHRG